MSLTPRGMSVQEAYRLYAEGKFLVNRRYQRKLVWSEQEKRHLIDSVERGYPVPLFMLAKVEHDDNSYEIIDGMQRLNAIFAFIEHRFVDEEGACFDLGQFTRARIQRDQGAFQELPADVPRMSEKDCAAFMEYQLAVTIDTEGSDTRINEVFGRINSGGRRLSPQEQRQAGLVSSVSESVRRVAAELRGDDSPDVLPLNQVPAISFNTPRERQGYGVDAADIFWCRHGIITPNDLAKAEDEQVVADILISILNDKPLNASREVFDRYFTPGSDEFLEAERRLNSYDSVRIRDEILSTTSVLRSIFEQGEFISLRNCVQAAPSNTARTAFYAIFMALHHQIHREGRIPDDFAGIRNALNNVQKSLTMQAHYTRSEDRESNIAKITGLIQKFFLKQDNPVLTSAHALVVDVENSLRRSKYEASRYEFKVGVCTLADEPALDPDMYAKIARTCCAIANSSPESDGYLYLGIADKKSAADRIEKLFGTKPHLIGNVYFTGIEHDLKALKLDVERYVKRLISEISDAPISDPLKTQIITSIDHAEYRGMPFVRIRVPRQQDLSQYDGEYPIRKNSETVSMGVGEAVAQAKLFGRT